MAETGQVLWSLPAERFVCAVPLSVPPLRLRNGAHEDAFHLNAIMYIHHERALIVTSRYHTNQVLLGFLVPNKVPRSGQTAKSSRAYPFLVSRRPTHHA